MTKKEKMVVTGGAGFVGSHLVDALLTAGKEVHVVDNYAGGKRSDRINSAATYHEVDITNYDALLPILKDAVGVFHEAALPRVQFSIQQPLETMNANVVGTANVLVGAQKAGVRRVVCASSGSVYGDQEAMPYHEELPPQPKSPYALHKHMLEQLCKLWSEVYGLQTVALRYFNVYGPRMDPDGAYALAIAKFIKQRQEGKPITIWGDGSHSRDFTHVRDIVRANVLAMESPLVGHGEVLNVGAGRNISVMELATLLGGSVVHEAERLEPMHCRADTQKAKALLGWEPQVKFEDGIAELKKLAGLT